MDLSNTGQPEPFTRITIDTLPDDVLLEIFDFYSDAVADNQPPFVAGGRNVPLHEDFWHTLVHVCRRWRCIVSASTRRLNLQLLCTERRPVKRNIWPQIPISIWATIPKSGRSRSQGVKNIVAALKQHHNRVRRIALWDIPSSLLKKFGSMKTSFPALAHLALRSTDERAPVLLDSFLEGSASRLQSLFFQNITFPALGKLLLSSRDLSGLYLYNIPHSGYISPDALLSSLSGLTRLNNLFLSFQSPRSRGVRESRVLPSLPRVVLPALAELQFKGDSEYLEDMLSRIDAPLHVLLKITFFNQLSFDTPFLRDLINRAQTYKPSHRAVICFYSDRVFFILFQKHGPAESRVLDLGISCRPSDWQLSSLTQLIGSSIPPLPALEHLNIFEGCGPLHWQDDIENSQWLELLRPFPSVKDLALSGQLVSLVAPALGELIKERVTEVLPVLQTIFLQNLRLSGPSPWQTEIGRFVTARQISGRPVVVDYPENTVDDT